MEKKNFSFISIFQHNAEKYPNKPAIIEGDKSRTHREVYDNARRVARYLDSHGVGPGEKIALISQNSVDFIEVELGIIMTGAVPVKINWRLAAPEIEQILKWNEINCVLFRPQNEEFKKNLYSLCRGYYHLIDIDELEKLLAGAPLISECFERNSEDIIVHFLTSGTTGHPKTVRISEKELLAEIDAVADAMNFKENNVFQIMSQLFHSACVGTYACLLRGGTVVLFRQFNPKSYIEGIEKYSISRISTIPTVLRRILECDVLDEYDTSKVETISYSTCPMPPDLIKKALERFDCEFYQAYGMTEMASIVTLLTPEDHRTENGKYLNSVGRPIKGHSVRIEDENGNILPPGTEGEIVVSGVGMMVDYYKMPEETEKAIRNGWYHTGDIGYMDADGYLYICGRKNDLIISGGENIYPREVENVLRTMPDVEEVAVLGVNDKVWIEAVHACFVMEKNAELTMDEVKAFCTGKIAKFKIPKEIHVVKGGLPKTATGKVCLPKLREMIEAGEI